MLNRVVARNFSIGSQVRNLFRGARDVGRDIITPTGGDSGVIGTTNLAFDEVAQEWHSVITEAPYELANSQSLDVVAHNNFGTVDNPNVIFTGDIPFRFVGCAGQPNEDDFDGHELMFFLLREGPLQRCQGCGQVFKLVRLRNEVNETGHYYSSSLINQDIEEMGEADHFINFNPFRGAFMNSHDHTMFEIPSNQAYSLLNPDDHDKFLTDPAYRLERIKTMEEKTGVFIKVNEEMAESFDEQYGVPKLKMSKNRYENIVKAEIAIAELDKHMHKVNKFNLRHAYDPQNHRRREARLAERAKERTVNKETIYLNGITEEELQYNDYFETDLEQENDRDNALNSKVKALEADEMQMKDINFQETWTGKPEPDAQPIVQQKIFRFKYRQALGNIEDHERREERMLSRMNENLDRLLDSYNNYISHLGDTELNELESKSEMEAYVLERDFMNTFFDFNLRNYENYFETDLEQDMELIRELPGEAKLDIIDGLYVDYLNEYFDRKKLTHVSLEKHADDEKGFLNNLFTVLDAHQDKVGEMRSRIDLLNFEDLEEDKETPQVEDKANKKQD